MKKVLSAVALFAVVLFAGCGGQQQKTSADYLTKQTKGWVLTAATSDPAYVMTSGERITDIYNDGYLKDFERDYILIFQENGSLIVKPGKHVAPSAQEGYTAETNIGTWQITTDLVYGEILTCQIPFFYDTDEEVCRIVSINDKEMNLNCTIDDEDPAAKAIYTFRMKFEPAK